MVARKISDRLSFLLRINMENGFVEFLWRDGRGHKKRVGFSIFSCCLRCSNGTTDLSTTLSGGESGGADGAGLLDDLLALGEDNLDVRGARHVGVDLKSSIDQYGPSTGHDAAWRGVEHTRP